MTGNDERPGRSPDGNTADPNYQYETLLAGSADVNVVLEADGLIRYASPASHRLFGWDPLKLEGRRLEELVHADDLASFREGMAELEEEPFVTSTFRLLSRNRSYSWTETTSRRVTTDGRTVVVATVRDISERHERMLLLQVQARADPLTGVANRTVLMDRLEQGLRRLERSGKLLAVLYLDLDQFKVINDALGHRVGDSVLLQMAEAAFAETVVEQLDANGVPHHQLLVEVTEQVLMDASKSAMTGLRALRDAGVQVGLDDFGTGYSSLAYLQQFPLDFVKIDGSFVRDLDRDAGSREVVAATIALAHASNLEVVAEGVETQGQRKILETLECDRAQGYLFSPAILPELLNDLLRGGV